MKLSPIYLAAVAIGILCAMDPLVKYMTESYPAIQVAFFRFSFGILVSIALLSYFRPSFPKRASIITNAARSVLVALSVPTLFYSIRVLPLATAVTISFMSPILIALLASFFLKEKLSARVLFSLVFGTVGMCFVVNLIDQRVGMNWALLLGAASGLFSAITYSLAIILLRVRATKDPIVTIVFFQNLGPLVLLAVPALLVWKQVHLADLPIFLLIGIFGSVGHFVLATAFSRADAARLAPMEYTALVWGVGYGFIFFGELPTWVTWIGIAMIMISAYLVNTDLPAPATEEPV